MKGFIVDSPNALIETKVGSTAILTAKSGSIKFGSSTIEITGGQSFFNLAEIDGKKDITIDLSDAEWKLSTMELATGGVTTNGAGSKYYFGEAYTIASDKITIPYVVETGSVKINGFAETSNATPAVKEFKVTVNASSTDITFNGTPSLDGETVYPTFTVAIASGVDTLSVKTDDFPKSGKVVLQFPIYSDSEAEDSEVVGYGQFVIYKSKIKTDYEVGGQYKSASEFKVQLKGLDPRRADKKMWDFQYIPA